MTSSPQRLGKINRGITSIFGSSNEKQIKKIGFVCDKHGKVTITPGSLIDRINGLEPAWQAKTNDELLQTTQVFRDRLSAV